MITRAASIVAAALGIVSLGLMTPRAQADVVANPAPPPAGAIQVGFQGGPVQKVQVNSGNQNDAVWLANQFNGTLWAYTFAGEMIVVDPRWTYVMADLPPAAGLPWPGTMGPKSPFPGATITVLQIQMVPESISHPPGMWVVVEIQGGDLDVIFVQYLNTIYSYNTGT